MNDLQIHAPKAIDFAVDKTFSEHLPEILSNVEEVKQWALAQTTYDRNAVVTEETLEDAKERATALNKVIQAIDKERKDVKKVYNEPYAIFESKIKEVVKVLTDARENLWSQALEFEKKIKEEKQDTFKKYWEEINEGLTHRLYSTIENPSWLNKGKSYKSVYKEMDELKIQQQNELAAIIALNSEFVVTLINDYLSGASLATIIAKNGELQKTKAAFVPVQTAQEPQISENKVLVDDITAQEDQEKYTVNFYVKATRVQLSALKDFFVANGIEFGRI